MGDTNFISGVVKILEVPKKNVLSKDILFSSFRAQFPEIKKNSIVHLKFWGNLARDVADYYQINDYILIEGYVGYGNSQLIKSTNRQSKKIEITVLKIYPIALDSSR